MQTQAIQITLSLVLVAFPITGPFVIKVVELINIPLYRVRELPNEIFIEFP